MYLWKLKRNDKLSFDQTHAVIVVAEYSNQAREIAGGAPGTQPPSIWYMPTPTVQIECIGTAAEGMTPGIVLCDFAS